MKWNWQRADWPRFAWDESRLTALNSLFLLESGLLLGVRRHLSPEDRDRVTVDELSTEAQTTSEIEGEILDRASVRSSIRRQLGLAADAKRTKPAEEGIAEMMVDLYRRFSQPLTDEMLFNWHRMILRGHRDIRDIGRYRTGGDPMQVVSGASYARRVHFEAPPAVAVKKEMKEFLTWMSREGPPPALTRAGVAHLYFVSIHPFEDGNGRIARAISEKALSEALGHPTLIALAATILARRKQYYDALEAANQRNEITDWLTWFGATVVEAQRRSIANVEFLIDKTRLLDHLRGSLNARQDKALHRMFREGPEGFRGGMSAGKYASITGASPATATRDLTDLVEKGALLREGEHRYARYHLSILKQVVMRPE